MTCLILRGQLSRTPLTALRENKDKHHPTYRTIAPIQTLDITRETFVKSVNYDAEN